MIKSILDYEVNKGTKEVWLEDESNDLPSLFYTRGAQ